MNREGETMLAKDMSELSVISYLKNLDELLGKDGYTISSAGDVTPNHPIDKDTQHELDILNFESPREALVKFLNSKEQK